MMNRQSVKNRFCLQLAAASLLLAVSFAGCQVTGAGKLNQSSTKSISQIAEESMQAAQADSDQLDFNQFTTMESSIDEIDAGSSSRVQPVSKARRAASRNRRGGGGRILIDEIFDQTDVREALQAISSQANVPIIVDDQVAGNITALIQNEPLEQALRKVLLPLGLHYRVVDGEYLICSSDPTSPMFSIISERLDFAPIHTAPAELVELLSEKNSQFVRIAPKRNMLIIEAPAEIAYQIVDELKRFDQPVPQVVLEAMVVVVSPDSGFQFGSNLRQGVGTAVDSGDDINLAIDGLALSGNLSGDLVTNLFRRFSVTSFFIRALEQEGYLTIRATPHVMAKHGEKAEISIARETFFSTQPANADQFFRQDIQKVEAGISLIITPTIRGDNVTMLIEKAEVSEDIRATVSDPAVNNPFPLINRRQVSTTVNVKDGETIVIGGLMQNQLVDRISSVPVLGNLPVIGRFFTQITQEEQAAEVVVFISPRVVRHADDHPMAGAEHTANSCSEFIHDRRFPRNNGLELGGPVVTSIDGQHYSGGTLDEEYDQRQTPAVYQSEIPEDRNLQYAPAPPVSYRQEQNTNTAPVAANQHAEFQHNGSSVPAMRQRSPRYSPAGHRANALQPPQQSKMANGISHAPATSRQPAVLVLTADPSPDGNKQASHPIPVRGQNSFHANNPLRKSNTTNRGGSTNLRDKEIRTVGYESPIR